MSTVELRKNLKKEHQKPRGEIEALGATWKVL